LIRNIGIFSELIPKRLIAESPDSIIGLDYIWDTELCLEAGKLFHIHLNSQDGQRYDQDLPFGYTEPLKDLALEKSRGKRGRNPSAALP
jgi:hypothetical protein